jgi:hypothetical protein
MHSNEHNISIDANKNAHDAMLNIIIIFGSLQILPPGRISSRDSNKSLRKRRSVKDRNGGRRL